MGREQHVGFSALAKCCGTAFGKEGSDLSFVAVANKIHAEPDDEWLQSGQSRLSLEFRGGAGV